MKSVFKVLKEQLDNFYLIRRLSSYELLNKNTNHYLGITWEIINPSIQLVIYWFVFGTIRSRAPVVMGDEEITFFAWLLGGFFIWIFCYQSITQGSKSIFSRLRMLSKMNFPMSVIPNFVIFANFYIHLVMILITIVILHFMGFYVSIYYFQIIYFMFAAMCLLFSLSLVTSTLSTMIRDVHQILNSILRMLFYVSGVLWPLSLLKEFPKILLIAELNPIYYLVQGYRAAFFGTEWYFITHWQFTVSFWIIVLILLVLGSTMHVKFRRHFIDYL